MSAIGAPVTPQNVDASVTIDGDVRVEWQMRAATPPEFFDVKYHFGNGTPVSKTVDGLDCTATLRPSPAYKSIYVSVRARNGIYCSPWSEQVFIQRDKQKPRREKHQWPPLPDKFPIPAGSIPATLKKPEPKKSELTSLEMDKLRAAFEAIAASGLKLSEVIERLKAPMQEVAYLNETIRQLEQRIEKLENLQNPQFGMFS